MGLSYWSLTLYPQAAEAGGCFQRRGRAAEGGGGEPDVERAQEEAARRARTKVRRYCAANRLNRFATLTYAGAGCFDHRALRADVAGFFRGLRGSWVGSRCRICGCPSGTQAGTASTSTSPLAAS
jgi:hypothetical protein